METTLEQNVDPITGEILPTIAENVDADSLANYGRWIRSKQRALDHLNNPRPATDCQCENCNLSREIRKLNEIHRQRSERLEHEVKEQMAMAESFVMSTGQKVINHPGIGRFRFRTLPAKLDRSKYESLTDRQRTELHTQRQAYFPREVVFKPDWKRIAAEVKEDKFGNDLSNPELNNLFTMTPGAERFEFKPE